MHVLTDDIETVSSAAGGMDALIGGAAANGSMNGYLVSVLARLSAKSKHIGSMSAGLSKKRLTASS